MHHLMKLTGEAHQVAQVAQVKQFQHTFQSTKYSVQKPRDPNHQEEVGHAHMHAAYF